MDPAEILNVRFHYGGEFLRIGPNLDYVGGDEAMSEIERDKLSLQEVKGFLKDHMELKESMKLYFLIPGQNMVSGLVFLNEDNSCVKMAEYVCVGGVADVFVEYHGEEESEHSSSGSDFENEVWELSDLEPDVVITAAEPAESDNDVLITDETGVIKQVISSPLKQPRSSTRTVPVDHVEVRLTATQEPFSQVVNPSVRTSASANSDSDLDGGTEYIAFTDDSGEESEVVELRKHARKF